MYNHALHREKKHFFNYCLQAFSTEILKCHIKDCFKFNGKLIIMSKKGEYVKFRNYERKIKSPFIIYADFEWKVKSRRVTNKYQKYIACSYGNKLVCVDDKFSKPFKTYLGKVTVYNFIISMIKESR